MFKYNFLLKKKKILLSTLGLLAISNSATSISVSTLKSIEGYPPYVSFDNGQTKSEYLSPLLSITLPNGEEITAHTDTSSTEHPIKFDNEDVKFSDIKTIVTLPSQNANYPRLPIQDVILNSNFWGDDDGDNNPVITGDLLVNWTDGDGNDLTNFVKNNQNAVLDPCDAPFKLLISADNGTISTQYGIPNQSSFIGEQHAYYMYPKVASGVKFCYAQPNINNEGDVDNTWVRGKGFKINDTDNPGNNFPTIGSNNLFFDLKLAGLSVAEVIDINGTNVSSLGGTGVHLALSEHNGKLRVTLKGPSAATNGGTFVPSIFKLYADRNKTHAFYSFFIQRWMIAFPDGPSESWVASSDRCNTLNGRYNLPAVWDFTNSNRTVDASGNQINWENGVPGVGEIYRRKISYRNSATTEWIGGLFSEWGKVTREYYPDSDWIVYDSDYGDAYYWAATVHSPDNHYVVESGTGVVGFRVDTFNNFLSSCVAW